MTIVKVWVSAEKDPFSAVSAVFVSILEPELSPVVSVFVPVFVPVFAPVFVPVFFERFSLTADTPSENQRVSKGNFQY